MNDPKFSKRVLEIKQTTDGPPGVGTVFESTVKDAGMKSHREIKLTEFERPTTLRWTEISKNAVTSADGGYDLEPAGEAKTKLTFFNLLLEGHGIGKLIDGFALRSARKGEDEFVQAYQDGGRGVLAAGPQGRRGVDNVARMADESLLARIESLVKEEHALIDREAADAGSDDALAEDRARLERVSVELDQCWDLLRQRRARRRSGGDPNEASARDESTVEGYLQ